MFLSSHCPLIRPPGRIGTLRADVLRTTPPRRILGGTTFEVLRTGSAAAGP
jgi:hypothetical protein